MPAVQDRTPSRTDELQLLKLHGTENQRERWAEGLLPEDELLALARNVLFEPFAEFRRWQKLQLQDVQARRDCTGGTIAFTTRKPDDLTADEWALYKKISGVAIDHVTRMHELRKAAGGLPYQLTGITKVAVPRRARRHLLALQGRVLRPRRINPYRVGRSPAQPRVLTRGPLDRQPWTWSRT